MSIDEHILVSYVQLHIKYMLEYQKKNNIINHCITNAQYLRDFIVANGMEAKVIAVLCLNYRQDVEGPLTKLCKRHMCVEMYGTVMEPSYQIASMERKEFPNIYYQTIKEIKDCPMISQTEYKLTKEEITEFITFQKYAQEMNYNKLLVSDKDYYNKQADYVENKMSFITNNEGMTRKQYLTMLQSRI